MFCTVAPRRHTQKLGVPSNSPPTRFLSPLQFLEREVTKQSLLKTSEFLKSFMY